MSGQASYNNQISVGQSSVTSQDQSNRRCHTILSQDELCCEGIGAEDPSRSLVRGFERRAVQNKNIAGWIQSLPREFDDSKDGVIKELASSGLPIFQAIQRTIVNQAEGTLLYEQQRRYAIWLSGIGSLDHKMNEQPYLRKCIVSNVVSLMLILINGKKLFQSSVPPHTNEGIGGHLLEPAEKEKLLPGAYRLLEQASSEAIKRLDEAKGCSSFDLSEWAVAARSKIESTIQNLYDLLPALEGPAMGCDGAKPRDIKDVDIFDGDALVSNFCSTLFHKYPGEFDDAAPWILKVSAYANLMRGNIIKPTSPTVSNAYALMPSSPDDTGVDEPVPSLSPPKTGEVSDASAVSFGESLQTDPLPMIRDHPQTTTGAYSSDPGLSYAHDWQATSSQGHDTKNYRNCPLCGTVFGASQGPIRHLIGHIKMWHCCQPECEHGSLLFDSEEAWMGHTIDSHGNQYKWKCANCNIPPFRQRDLLRSHRSLVHNEECDYKSLEQKLEDSRTVVPHKQCHFCHDRPTFNSWADYRSHVRKHLEHISSLVFSPLVPDPKSQKYTKPFAELMRRTLRLLKSLAPGKNEKSHKQRIMIWDDLEKRQYSHWVLLDSGTVGANMILRSVVEKRGLQTFDLEPDQRKIGTVNDQSIDASEYVVPEWHFWVKGHHKIQRDVRFVVVESLPTDVDMVLEDKWLPPSKLSSLVTKLNPQAKERVSDEQQRSACQIQDGKKREARREAEIRAARYSQPGVNPLPGQPESPASSRHEERKGNANIQPR